MASSFLTDVSLNVLFMQLRTTNPLLETSSFVDILRVTDFNYLTAILKDLSEYYDSKLKYSQILSNYGVDIVVNGSDQNVNCVLPEHGTKDTHASSKYYTVDRNSGERRESTYCYKCQRTMTAFWFLFHMERTNGNFSVLKLIDLLEITYKIPPPVDLLLDFDPESYYTMEARTENSLVSELRRALRTHQTFKGSPEEHIRACMTFINDQKALAA